MEDYIIKAHKLSSTDYDDEILEKIAKAINGGSRRKDNEECASKRDIDNLKTELKSDIDDIKFKLNDIKRSLNYKEYNSPSKLSLSLVVLILLIGTALGWSAKLLIDGTILSGFIR